MWPSEAPESHPWSFDFLLPLVHVHRHSQQSVRPRVMATASASSSTASAVAKNKKKTVKPLSKKKLEKFQEAAENRGERIKAAARPPRAHTHTNIAARPRSLPREAPAIALGGSFPGQRDATP